MSWQGVGSHVSLFSRPSQLVSSIVLCDRKCDKKKLSTHDGLVGGDRVHNVKIDLGKGWARL